MHIILEWFLWTYEMNVILRTRSPLLWNLEMPSFGVIIANSSSENFFFIWPVINWPTLQSIYFVQSEWNVTRMTFTNEWNDFDMDEVISFLVSVWRNLEMLISNYSKFWFNLRNCLNGASCHVFISVTKQIFEATSITICNNVKNYEGVRDVTGVQVYNRCPNQSFEIV